MNTIHAAIRILLVLLGMLDVLVIGLGLYDGWAHNHKYRLALCLLFLALPVVCVVGPTICMGNARTKVERKSRTRDYHRQWPTPIRHSREGDDDKPC